MSGDLPLRCSCGTLRGALRDASAERGNRVVCYCDDCQVFACFLGAAGRTLDAHGGTDIFQTSSGRIAFSAGSDRLSCIRVSASGPLRWYASCCRTPIGNTLASRQLPLIGLIHAAIDPALDGRAREALLGPVRTRVHTRFARRGAPGADVGFPAGAILRVLRIAIAARLRGDHRRTPFFDAATGAPIAPPRALGDEELRRARAAREAL
jgi:hypothetical protein